MTTARARRLRCGRAAGLAAAVLVDAVLADPGRAHPVAGFGRVAALLERHLWRDSRAAGVGYAAAALLPVVAAAALAEQRLRSRPALYAAATAVAGWAVLGGESLRRAGTTMHRHLTESDLAAARAHLPTLAGRDPSGLGEAELVRATVESLAENTSDAVVGPLLWGAVAGLPGLVGFRAVNTLDAMVGHRSPRHARFGTAAARLDDVACWVPARLSAAVTVAVAPVVGGTPRRAAHAWWRDGAAHPSPNAGRCEASAAGALGVRLGGRNVYGERVEVRPPLGDGPPPGREDVARAVRLSRAVQAGTAALAVAVAAAAAGASGGVAAGRDR